MLPIGTLAVTKSISPDAELMPGPPDGSGGPNQSDDSRGFYSGGWIAPLLGTTYTVTWSDLDPSKNYMIVGIGDVTNVVYGGSTITMTMNSINMWDPNNINDTSHTMPGLVTGIADMASTDQGPRGRMSKSIGGRRQGPPAESRGMWISTNTPVWQLQPGEFDRTTGKPKTFKIQVTGPSGEAGFFRWYWPKALLGFMGIKPADLAGFVDNDQMKSTVTTYSDGSALISMNYHYSTHVLKTGKALPLSLATNKKRVSKRAKNKRVKLFGWLSNRKRRQIVKIYRKKAGQKKYSMIGRVRTKAKGYYSRTIPVTKKSSFKAMAKVGRRWITSPIKTVTVR